MKSEEWLDIVKTEISLTNKKYRYFQNNISLIKNDLRESLKDNKELPFVLNIIKDINDIIAKELIDELVFISVYGEPSNLANAKDILLRIDKGWLEINLMNSIKKVLAFKFEEDYLDYLYRNIADLFYSLNFKEILNSFLDEYCKNATDKKLQEIYEDYYII